MILMNINRDYLIILDVKSGEVDSPNIYYFNTDKNTSNLYVQMVIKETSIEATPIDNANNYSIKANILKPNMVGKEVEGTLVNPEKAIYEFALPADCTDFSGNAKIEFEVYTGDKIATSFATKFKVHGSVLTEQNKYIEDSSDYPILKELMEEVKVINETAHELDTTIRTLQSDMIDANNEMKTNEATRQTNETTRVANEESRVETERTRVNQEASREQAEATREANEQRRIANEDERKVAENQRKANEFERRTNENERKSAEASRVSAENARANAEEVRQTNEANRETAEEIRKANEQARIAEHEVMRTEHEQTMTAVNEVKAENAILMENDKKIADRMTQVEISDKRQYVIMEGLMNSAGDGYLKIEDTGNDTTLYNSVEGFVDVKNITGNTMVNSIKNPDDELTLNADINTSGQSVTLTTAVDNGQVDVLAEGNTMVNVCDQQEAVAITKSYTVETGNHVALQGEYDGKARPVPTGNTLVNLATEITGNGTINGIYSNVSFVNPSMIKPQGLYTAIIKNMGNKLVRLYSNPNVFAWKEIDVDSKSYAIVKLRANDTITEKVWLSVNEAQTEEQNLEIILLEGDYTNKPIPDYFEGMKSSFEDKLVTQEMVDNGKELAENLGKYRLDYKVTGKNKFDGELIKGYWHNASIINDNNAVANKNNIPVKPNMTYTISIENYAGKIYMAELDSQIKETKSFVRKSGENITTSASTKYLRFCTDRGILLDVNVHIQLEEGSTATAYEPYKENIKTYYLNSPLLEGDTIEESSSDVYHVHRSNRVTFDGSNDEGWKLNTVYNNGGAQFVRSMNTSKKPSSMKVICDKLPYKGEVNKGEDGIWIFNTQNLVINLSSIQDISTFKSWLQANPTTIIYQLASPTKELISQSDTILTDSYVAGHLDFDTAVPVERVDFMYIGLKCKYLYPLSDYVVQFESDNVGVMDKLVLGGQEKTNLSISKGLNKIYITSGDKVSNPYLDIFGIGFSASNIVVTEATDKDFGYFSGMKSVGELEENKIEILSSNKNLINTVNDLYKEHSNYDFSNIVITDNSYIFNNALGTDSSIICKKIKVKPNTKYVLTVTQDATGMTILDSSTVGCNIDIYRTNNIYLSGTKTIKDSNSETTTIVFTSKPNEDELVLKFTMRRGMSGTMVYSNIQLEEGSTATDYIISQYNKKQILLNEPLRAVGDTKDRFVQIDGKWYVERNCGEYTIPQDTVWTKTSMVSNTGYTRYFFRMDKIMTSKINASNYKDFAVSDRLPFGYSNSWGNCNRNELQIINNSAELYIQVNLSTIEQVASLMNGTKIVYKLDSPTYEPVEIAPTVNTYTDVTHITNNSTIPMNMPIKNSGYEIIAKPSTKYTVVGMTNGRIGDSTIVNGTITTPATITDNFLRPYGTGKTSKVMLLEGEPANIPGYFKGIKSVFEDKVTEDGKYACKVRVYNDLGEETVQTLYLDEPLYNTNNITIYNDKLGYWKNWDKVVLDGSEDENLIASGKAFAIKGILNFDDSLTDWKEIVSRIKSNYKVVSEGKLFDGADYGVGYKPSVQSFRIRIPNINTIANLRQYLSENPVTVVYQLKEPIFIPLIDNCPNWVIGSWDNCSIHFDSIIPLLSTRYRYTGNVPSVMTMSNDVATNSAVSDEQDSMIVDLATQVAVLEMMTL